MFVFYSFETSQVARHFVNITELQHNNIFSLIYTFFSRGCLTKEAYSSLNIEEVMSLRDYFKYTLWTMYHGQANTLTLAEVAVCCPLHRCPVLVALGSQITSVRSPPFSSSAC